MASDLTTAAADDHPRQIADETTIMLPVIRRKRRWLRRLLLAVLALVLVLGGTAYAFAQNPTWMLPLGNAVLGQPAGTVAWNGSDPLNILVLGIDQRTNEATRSDSMIVLHLDPASRSVQMLSVPRDLWITLPGGYNPSKINAAYALGGAYGPQFAQLAVESALHIPINYYAVIKFSGFKSIVDAIGGLSICVPLEIIDTQYPDDVGYGMHTLHIKAGCQTMDGATALAYERERHADPQQDLGRIQQQQALLAAMEKQVLSPGTILRSPAVLAAARSSLITNLPPGALPTLAAMMYQARDQRTKHYYLNIDDGYVSDSMSSDGQDILVGNWPKINALVSNVFADPALQAEHATVQVRNGQHTAGLAAMYTGILQGMGFTVTAPRDADAFTYVRNQIVVNSDRPGSAYTVRKLAQMFQADVTYRHGGADQPHIALILGSEVAEGQ